MKSHRRNSFAAVAMSCKASMNIYTLVFSITAVDSVASGTSYLHLLPRKHRKQVPCWPNYKCHKAIHTYRGVDKSSAQPGRNQATATEDFDVHISYL